MQLVPSAGTLSVIEKITYKNESEEELKKLYMNVYFNSLSQETKALPFPSEFCDEVYAKGVDYSRFQIQSLSIGNEDLKYHLKGSLLEIQLDTPLKPQEETELTLEFDAYIPKINYKIGRNENSLWLGNAIPSMAVYQNGSWNTSPYYGFGEPFYSKIGSYDVTVIAPEDYTVIAPGTYTSSSENGIKTTHISAKMIRDFSFALGNSYEKNSTETSDGIDIHLYHLPQDSQHIDEILSSAKNSLEFYVKNIGSYPYQKLDIIESDLYYQGDAEYSQFVLLDNTYLRSKTRFNISPFQFGFQWFNCILGTNQGNNGWLNIGITNFLQLYMQYSAKDLSEFMKQEAEKLKAEIAAEPLPAMSAPLSSFISYEQYHNAVEKRSTFMIYALYRKIGQEKFFQLLQNYYSLYSFKTAGPSEFIPLSQDLSGQNLTEFYHNWTMESEIPAF